MKKSLKALAAALLVTMGLGLAACGGNGGGAPAASAGEDNAPKQEAGQSNDETIHVGVIQYMEHGSLDLARQGFVDGLAAAGYEEGKNITFDVHNAQQDQSNLQTIAQTFINNKVDMVCAIATPAAQTMAAASADIPIVATAVTDYVEAKLVDANEAPGHNVTGVSDMVSIEDQIDLLLELAPEAKTIGVMYSSNEINSELQAGIAKDYIISLGLAYEEGTITNSNDIQQAAQSLVNKIDALYIPTDNVLAGSIPTLVMVTDEAKLPIVTGATSMVEDGALATIGIDYYKLGLQTGAMAAKILDGAATPAEMPVETAKDVMLVLNQGVADRLGIAIPESILAREPQIVGEE